MNFEDARKRNDYKFIPNGIEKIIDEIRNGCMKDLEENGDGYRGVAVLIIGYVDIELNVHTCAQCGLGNSNNKTPVFGYFTCLKHGDSNNDWESDDYIDYDVKVDWNSNGWLEQLEKDMFTALDVYVDSYGYRYDLPN